MITAERLQHLINQTPKTLTELVDKEGVEFCLSEFKGISNGGQFVYKVLYENMPPLTAVQNLLGREQKAES